MVLYDELEPADDPKQRFNAAVIFCKTDIHTTEDIIVDIKRRFEKIYILPVLEMRTFYVIDLMFKFRLEKICFEFAPQQVLDELNVFLNNDHKEVVGKKQYIINFYENKGTFFIDLSGSLKIEQLLAHRLMFSDYLKSKIKSLRGVVYIFNNVDELTLSFINIWALFRYWPQLGLNYNQIYYLTSSKQVALKINKYIESFGVKHFHDLLEIVGDLYPEIRGSDELRIFEFTSKLLQSKNGVQ